MQRLWPFSQPRVVDGHRSHQVSVEVAELGPVVLRVDVENVVDEGQVRDRVAQGERVLRRRVDADPVAIPVGEGGDLRQVSVGGEQGAYQLHERDLAAVVGYDEVDLRPVAEDHLGEEDRVIVTEDDPRSARLGRFGDFQGLGVGRRQGADTDDVGREIPDGLLNGLGVADAAVDHPDVDAVAQCLSCGRGQLHDADVGIAGVVRGVAVVGGVGGVREQ